MTTGPLHGKVAIVTGGARGIGRGISERLAADGARVVIGYVDERSDERAAEVVRGIEERGGGAIAFRGDVADPAEAARLVETAVASFGRLDALINNAAIADYRPFGTFEVEAVRRTLEVNVLAPFVLSQLAAERMTEGGRIVLIGSTVATRTARLEGSLYATSKSALIGMTKGMARDLAPRGITVNLVNPGPTETEMNDRQPPEKVADMVSFTALKRRAKPFEIAALVAPLLRDDAAYATGAIIGVDGGYTI